MGKFLKNKGFGYTILILIAAIGIIGFLFISNTFDFKDKLFGSIFSKPSSFAASAVDYYGKDISFFGVYGQPKMEGVSKGKISDEAIFHASWVLVDRSSTPNKIYVVDSGNSRILGFNGFSNQKKADLVIGQPDFTTGDCNGDSNLGMKKKPTAATLCLMKFPEGTNTGEQWGRNNIDVDSQGNLYVVDKYNSRVLKYNQPFSVDKSAGKGDGVADFVWGQPDFESNGVNWTDALYQPYPAPNNQGLAIGGAQPPNDAQSAVGVSVDLQGNVWIADSFNSRVLRFPPNSKTADLVLGQSSFTGSNSSCTETPLSVPLNKFCTPILARVDPETGNLYVLDEHINGFRARMLVFTAPFASGQTAARQFVSQGGQTNHESPWWQSTGFIFNTYKEGEYAQGKMWVNENSSKRATLIDDNGNVIKQTLLNHQGGCGYDIYTDKSVFWPGGSIGIDSENNIYFADEFFNTISRYSLPYEPVNVNGLSCPPRPNGTLMAQPGLTAGNTYSDESLDAGVGLTVYQNQLIVQDGERLKVWNDYKNKAFGAAPDFVIFGGLNNGWSLKRSAIDDKGRLWTSNAVGGIRVYQLPFTQHNQTPLADNVPLYWADNGQVIDFYSNEGAAFDFGTKMLYFANHGKHRILRVNNYDVIGTSEKLKVDMVLGQLSKTEGDCNQGRGQQSPTAATLCGPANLHFDRLGNLYVVENNYECRDGNGRIVTYLKEDLAAAVGMFPNLEAKKVFVAPNFMTHGPCGGAVGQPGSPVTLAFNSKNQMVVGNDGYYGDPKIREHRQLWFYADPLNKQTPDAVIPLILGAPGEIEFDFEDNLLVQDHTWFRVSMLNLCKDPDWLEWVSGVSPVDTCGVAPSATPQSLLGDINKNNRVDVFDFNILTGDFGKTDTSSLRSDINGNGRVDVFDFNLMIQNFGKEI